MKFFYVYVLQSETSAGGFYVGFAEDWQTRLKKHNAGEVPIRQNFVRGESRLRLLLRITNEPLILNATAASPCGSLRRFGRVGEGNMRLARRTRLGTL